MREILLLLRMGGIVGNILLHRFSVYNYAVMRCKESQFLTLDPKDILAYRKRDFQIDVLVSNGKEAQKKYKGVVVDHVSVDEIMLLLVKGERV